MINKKKACGFLGLIAVMVFIGLLAPYTAFAGVATLVTPGNWRYATGVRKKVAIVYYNDGSTSETVNSVTLDNSNTSVSWGTVTAAKSGPVTPTVSSNLLTWTGPWTVPAYSTKTFYAEVSPSARQQQNIDHNMVATVNVQGKTAVTATVPHFWSQLAYASGIYAYMGTDTAPVYSLGEAAPLADGTAQTFTIEFRIPKDGLSSGGKADYYDNGTSTAPSVGRNSVVRISVPAGWTNVTASSPGADWTNAVVSGNSSSGWTITAGVGTLGAGTSVGPACNTADFATTFTFTATTPTGLAHQNAYVIEADFGDPTHSNLIEDAATACTTTNVDNKRSALDLRGGFMAVVAAGGGGGGTNNTTVGALTSTGATDTTISVSSAFTGDANGNNTCTLQWAPHGTTSWTTFASTPGSGVYTGTATGLTAGTAYDFRATYTDSDGVSGSPATLSNVSTTGGGGGGGGTPTVWLSSPGNQGRATGIAQKYGVVFYNPGSSAITVTQVDINDSDTSSGYGWGTTVSTASPASTWSVPNRNDIRWTGSISVPAGSTQTFYCSVVGNNTAPANSATQANLSATVTGTGGPYTSANNVTFESTSSYPTTVNGFFAASTSDNSANPLYVLANGGSPYTAGANVNFVYQIWSQGNNGGTNNRYIVADCNGGTQVKITLPAGWGQPTNFTVPSIFNTPTVTGSVSTGWTITAVQNAATASFGAAVLYNIQFSATAPTTYTTATASPITATYGGVNATTDYVESGSTSGCGATGSYYTPINVISNMAAMVAAGGSPGTTTGTISTTSVTDTSFTVNATYTGDSDNDNSCAITVAGGTVSTPTVNRSTKTWTASVTGLSPNTGYTISANFTDSTGSVTGTNPVTASQTTTNNGTTTGTMSATATADSSIAVQATYTRDPNANNTCVIAYSISASGPWTGLTTTKGTGLYSATASGLAAGTTYYFQATFTDADGISGTNPLALTQATTNNGTTTGTMSATATADTSISVQATFTRDPNANNTCQIAYSTSASGPWTNITTTKGAGLYSATASGLAAGTTYYFQATFTDADGIVGTNPLTLTSATTNNGTTTGAMSATATADTSIAVQATYTRDPNGNNNCQIAYSTSASGPWTNITTTKGAGLYSATASGLTAGTTYYFQATFTDGDGVVGTNPLTLTQATTNNGTTTGAMSATTITTTSIAVQATYTRDANANNTCQIAYSTSASGPWTNLTTTKGTGLYSATASGLTAGTTYYFQATFTDGDGIVGTNPLTLTQATSTANGTVTGTMTATTTNDTSIAVQATYTGDVNANNTCQIAYGTSASGPWTNITTTKGAGLYSATASGLTAGTTYYFQATFTDADTVTGTNPLTLTQTTTSGTTTVSISTSSVTTASFTVSATYTGDLDNDNSCTITCSGGAVSTATVNRTTKTWTASVTGLSPNTAYSISANFSDTTGSVSGTNPLTMSQTTPTNQTIAGTDSAVVNSGTQITVTANFTGDANGNSTTTFAYGPTSSGPWTTSCASVSGPSPRSCVISGLTAGNTYYAQVTYTDATDGVSGTNPQVIGPFITGITCDSKVTSCTDCHSLPPSAGSHLVPEHKGDASRNQCAVCHYNYKTMTNVTSARWTTSHTNNYLDIYTSNSINGGIKGGYYNGYRNRSSLWAGGTANSNNTCSNTYCHGTNPSPIWGSTNISCNSCHDAPPAAPAGSHAMHNQGYIGYADHSNATSYDFGCFKCHPQAQHAQGPATANSSAFVAFSNTSSPVALGGTYTVGTSQGNDSKGYKWSNATCSNALYCHSNGQGGNANVTPVWGTTVTNCTSCHGNAAAKASVTLSGSHPTHVGTDTYAFNCSQCHNKTISSGSSVLTNKALHVNGVKDVYLALYNNMTGYYSGSPNGTCRNVYCHSDGNGGAPNVTPQWGVTAITCSSCHNYKAPTAMSSGQHTYHTNTPNIGTFGCVQCHNRTVNASDQIQYANGKHVNGTKDVYFNGFNGYSGSYNAATKTCSNVYCHSSGQSVPTFRTVAAWNSVTTYNCKSCHGADTGTGTTTSQFGEPNYQNLSTASRSQYNGHSVHVSAASDCSKCHYGTATVNTSGGFASITSGGNHLNGTRDIHFRSDISGTYNATNKTCTDVSCHGGVGSGTFRWGGTGTCQSCHLASGNDVNDFTYGNGTKAAISLEDWTSAGHGRKSGTYRYTANVAANKVCTDCHSGSIAHGDSADPFRLISSATINPSNPNSLCLSCHTQADHDYAHVGIGTWAFTPKCIDCHDPHGDKAGVTAGQFNGAMIQQTVANTGSNNYGVPNGTAAVDWPANFARVQKLTSAPYYNWSSFVVNGTYNGVCQVCHNSTVLNFNNALFTGTHNNGQACVNCHSHASGFKPSGKCTDCHATGGAATTAGRRDIQADFSKKSHHINASWANISTRTCAMCHAEGNPDGSQNMTYHQSGKAVVLNVWNGAFVNGTGIAGLSRTFVRYTTGDGASGGLAVSATANLNPVCLSCHNRANANATPFKASGDSNKPTVYDVWDNSTSIDAMYSNTGTTFFSKYSPSTDNVVPQIVKAYSPHGNPTANQRGKAKYGPWVNDTIAAGSKVACFDCHNSHGSSVGSNPSNTMPLTSYSSTYSGTKGGLIKEYSPVNGSSTNQTTYMPTQGGSSAPYSASSALCFDCHLGDNASAPKTYKTPFGLKSTIDGYYDAGRWQSTDVWKGSFAYKTAQASGNGNGGQKGGHFGASSPLTYATTNTINGRCVMCHDPHGVAQNGNKTYMVPALRGTWMTSPYKEDRVASQSGVTDSNSYGSYWISKKNFKPARMNPRFNYNDPPYVGGGYGKGAGGNWGQGGNGADGYFIDDNTFGTSVTYSTGYPTIVDTTNSPKPAQATANHITETPDKFAGLCLGCHSSTNLQALNFSNGSTVIHVHNTVNGWYSAANAADLFKARMAGEHQMSYVTSKPTTTNDMRCTQYGSDPGPPTVMPSGYRWSVTAGTTTISSGTGTTVPPPSTVGQTVGGFKEANGFHRFPCSKCHTPHTSKLPRLMKTNCIDAGATTTPKHNTGYTYPICDTGYTGTTGDARLNMTQCHNIKATNTANGHGWNIKTGW